MMNKAEIKNYPQNDPEINLIPEDKVSVIKIKLGKSHRTEADWTIIKEILNTYNLIVLSPVETDDKLETVENILTEENKLIAFTNIDFCQQYIQHLNASHNKINRSLTLGAASFDSLIDLAEDREMDIIIDPADDDKRLFMTYVHGEHRLMAVRNQNPWELLRKWMHNKK